MEQGDATKTFEAFEEAEKHNASDPDIYYHRGQGNAQMLIADLALTPHTSTLHLERV
jgi:hypothetical protein